MRAIQRIESVTIVVELVSFVAMATLYRVSDADTEDPDLMILDALQMLSSTQMLKSQVKSGLAESDKDPTPPTTGNGVSSSRPADQSLPAAQPSPAKQPSQSKNKTSKVISQSEVRFCPRNFSISNPVFESS
jgi:hypothetical protein